MNGGDGRPRGLFLSQADNKRMVLMRAFPFTAVVCLHLPPAAEDTAFELSAMDDVSKLDPTNPQQLDALHRAFSHNLATVAFFLEFCVFPTETKQYTHKLSGNAWHMADNARGTVAGFSGTDDNHCLLPLQVHQQPVDALRGTNGKMLSVIVDKAQVVELTGEGDGGQESKPHSQLLLEYIVAVLRAAGGSSAGGKQGKPAQLHALIDCGAMLKGKSNW